MMNTLSIGLDIRTPYQLLSFLSFLDYSKSTNNILIINKDEYLSKFLSFKKLLYTYNCKVIVSSDKRDILKLVDSNNDKSINIISVNFPEYSLKIRRPNINLVTVNDGLSSYASFKSMYFNIKRSNRKTNILFLLIKFIGERILSKTLKFEEFYLHDTKRLKTNNKFAHSFKKLIDLKNSDKYPTIENKCLVFIGQPLVNLNIMSESDYISYLEQVQKYANDKGLEFYYKPHPLEKKEIYNCFPTIKYDGLVEELCALEKNISIVCSFYSTALVTLPTLFDIEATRITPNIKNLYFSPKQKKLLHRAKPLLIK
ncbi:hypothetical protein JFB93_20205 [Providencia rettgeri]|uniref:polysialyltransferase family glycosyltransferase n=1 Tax=Providencia rettgeri TaxID=587 RepID=UPI0018E794A3|nr:polysialyltransferase family glycosyltransferase [Providencia rettgeri]QQE93222.1 hypothetical protein JFB93_20205 [Providencia rettgeri]QWJ91685.1 alpha-2,8-polysialyltransferase family protein [Providencia rettgeri]